MTYEADPAGLGVGKRYGPLKTGGIVGAVGGVGSETTAVFQLNNGEDDGSNATSISLPAYAVIKEIEITKTAAYAASSTFDVQLDGTSCLATATPLVLTGTGYVNAALHATAANTQVGATAEDVTVVVNANGLASTTGAAEIVVTYTRV